MSKSIWLSPEEMIVRKKRNKFFLYLSILIGTILISTFVTVLANKI